MADADRLTINSGISAEGLANARPDLAPSVPATFWAAWSWN
jgi:hypothetical protein